MTNKIKLIFLDRDGVINAFPGMGSYVTRWEDFNFLPRAVEAVRLLTDAGFEIHVISNQGGVAKGLMTPAALEKLTDKMTMALEKGGGKVARVFYCVHQSSDGCDCKKPKTALFRKAIRGRDADLSAVYFIGDSEEDVLAGKNLGCRTMLVLSGRTKRGGVKKFEAKPDVIKKDLWEAARWLARKK